MSQALTAWLAEVSCFMDWRHAAHAVDLSCERQKQGRGLNAYGDALLPWLSANRVVHQNSSASAALFLSMMSF